MNAEFLFAIIRNRPYERLLRGAFLVSLLIAIFGVFAVCVDSLWPAYVVAVSLTTLFSLYGVLLIQSRHRGILQEIQSAIALEGGLSRWDHQIQDFFYDGAAATSALELLHLKILLLMRPQSLLELGSGQTTKLISNYQRQHPNCYALTLEQNASWYNVLKSSITHDYREAQLHRVEWVSAIDGQVRSSEWYQIPNDAAEKQYDYVLVDGPEHNQAARNTTSRQRSGMLSMFPSKLATRFVVVFDDSERRGEAVTTVEFEQALIKSGRAYYRFQIRGIKTQTVFCSPDLGYLRSV